MRRALHELEGLGPLVLIGGMLRDLALFGNADFRSDLDFVINPVDPELFDNKLMGMGASVNRFGGYALKAGKWLIDVWPLQRTWARIAGHADVNGFEDLKRVTFFSCDSIIYDIYTNKISAPSDYFINLDRKILDINLRPNPNPHGNAVRAFRYAMLKGFRWGPKLTEFVAEMIDEIGWDDLGQQEHRSYRTAFIPNLKRRDFEKALRCNLSAAHAEPFVPTRYLGGNQLELPFVCDRG